MRDHLFELLNNRHPSRFASLQQAMQRLSVETSSVEARMRAGSPIPHGRYHLRFADVSLSDGSWAYILNTAEKADAPLNLIVVGAIPETQDYLSVMDRQASDFVAPPFGLALLDSVGRAAATDTDTRLRGEALAPVAVV